MPISFSATPLDSLVSLGGAHPSPFPLPSASRSGPRLVWNLYTWPSGQKGWTPLLYGMFKNSMIGFSPKNVTIRYCCHSSNVWWSKNNVEIWQDFSITLLFVFPTCSKLHYTSTAATHSLSNVSSWLLNLFQLLI